VWDMIALPREYWLTASGGASPLKFWLQDRIAAEDTQNSSKNGGPATDTSRYQMPWVYGVAALLQPCVVRGESSPPHTHTHQHHHSRARTNANTQTYAHAHHFSCTPYRAFATSILLSLCMRNELSGQLLTTEFAAEVGLADPSQPLAGFDARAGLGPQWDRTLITWERLGK
jgi:hypothetical protein